MTLDLQPFFRSTIGFDQIAELFQNATTSKLIHNSYPPYNIEKTNEENYIITIAISGFKEENLEIIKNNNLLKIEGNLEKQEKSEKTYLYKGIATRSFILQFRLADYMEIKSVNLENGLLVIELFKNVPEAMKPQKIKIGKIIS